MKALLLISLFALTQAQPSSHLIVSETPFTPDATVRIQPDPECVKINETQADFRTAREIQRLKNCVQSKIETGSLNGIPYNFYYSDGSGQFAGTPGNSLNVMEPFKSNWHVACKRDAITDDKTCYMNLHDFWIFIRPDLRPSVSIGNEHYPGSSVAIRIDQQAPILSTQTGGSFTGPAGLQIIKELSKAKTVTTRYTKWPYKANQDSTWDVHGFNEALAYIRWAVARIK